MNCMYCKKGNLKNDFITKSYEKEGFVTVISGVPVLICDTCGQEFLEGKTVKTLEIIRNGKKPLGCKNIFMDYSL